MRIAITLAILTAGHAAHAQPAPEELPPPPSPEIPQPEVTPMRLDPALTDKPAAEPEPSALDKQVSVTYDRGLRFATRDDKFGMRLQLRSQLRFETTRTIDDDRQFESHFLIPRARMQVEGHVFNKQTRYRTEFSLGDTGGFAFVRDLIFDAQLSAAPVWLRAGQWKRPFNRHELVSDFASEFNERAITATFVGGGRDVGLALHNDYEDSPEGIEWVVGIFNAFNGGADRPDIGGCTTDMATGTTACPPPTNFPDDFAPAIVARAGWNSKDSDGYREGDLEGGPLRYAIAAAYKIDLGNFAKQEEETIADNLSHGAEVDAMIKVSGVSVQLGLYMMRLPASKATWRSGEAKLGAFGQVGYLVVPKRLLIAGRFAIAPDERDEDRNQLEGRVAVNVLWQGHAWKWATDAGVLKTTGEDPMTMQTDKPDLVIRSMLQLTL